MADFADVNGVRVISGRVSIPSLGIWIADVKVVNTSSLPLNPRGVTLTIGDLTLISTVFRQASYGGYLRVRLVGGAAGWRRTLNKKFYTLPGGVPLLMVLNDAALEVGELPVAITSTTILSTVGPSFTRPAEPATAVLNQLAGPYWYMSPSGITTVGPRSPASVGSTLTPIEYDGDAGRLVLASDSISDIAPGRLVSHPLTGQLTPLSYVEHMIPDDGIVRSEVLLV